MGNHISVHYSKPEYNNIGTTRNMFYIHTSLETGKPKKVLSALTPLSFSLGESCAPQIQKEKPLVELDITNCTV